MLLNCPYCQHKAMGPLKKSLLGPARSVKCQSCQKRVSVHWASALMVIPALMCFFGLPLIRNPAIVLPVAAFLVIVSFAAQLWWVPLVGREKSR